MTRALGLFLLGQQIGRTAGALDVLEPNRPASVDGGAGAGGTAREGDDEAGGVVVLRLIFPWGRPLGPMVFLTVRWVKGPRTRPVSTQICRGSSSPSASPC
jgi:hypothetical protein